MTEGLAPRAAGVTGDGPEPDPGTELARQLADIATVLLAPGGGAEAAETILSLARSTMDSCDEAGLCGGGSETRLSPLSDVVVQLDELQQQSGHGPCREVLEGPASVYVQDLLDDDTWPVFSPGAARLGIRTVLAYRLSVQGETVGALQLYAHLPGAFNAVDRAQGLLFASYAGLALAQANAQAAEESKLENLQIALFSREVIGQAQGILMERERITADQAFQLLRRSSQHLNRKLRAVAQEVVDTGMLTTELGPLPRL